MNFLFITLPSLLEAYAWIGQLVARIAVGLLFAISGFGKLTSAEKKKQMHETIREAGIPWPRFNAVFVSWVELVGGALLVLGLLTPLVALVLAINMLVATVTVHWPKWKGSLAAWLGTFLYLPEVLYMVILLWLLLAGPGWLSLDYLLRERLLT